MRSQFLNGLLSFAILGWSSPQAASFSADPIQASFGRAVMPVFEQRCSFCHSAENNYGGLVLEPDVAWGLLVGAAASQVSMQRVVPGDPERSYLLRKMAGTQREVGGIGTRMPPGWGGLTPDEFDLVRRWVLAGARRD